MTVQHSYGKYVDNCYAGIIIVVLCKIIYIDVFWLITVICWVGIFQFIFRNDFSRIQEIDKGTWQGIL